MFNRTSRHVSVTETGMLYFNHTRQMLDGLDEVEAAISNVTVTPRGTLKLSAPVWVANTLVARMLAEYHVRYPEVLRSSPCASSSRRRELCKRFSADLSDLFLRENLNSRCGQQGSQGATTASS